MKGVYGIIVSCLCAVLFTCSSCGSAAGANEKNDSASAYESGTQKSAYERSVPALETKDGGHYISGSEVVYPDSLWSAPSFDYEPTLDFGTEGVNGIFFTSPIKYNGKETRVAAYIGFPQGASAENKVPAIVLVHGGLGTAIPQWVKYWNDLGFAAISMDTEGGEPTSRISNENTTYHLERNRYAGGDVYEAGPTNNSYDDWNQPLENQWMYHATSSVILSTSLISSFNCVDTTKVGITGISWGSVITSIVLKYDDRLSFAMPIYGGITQSQSSGSSAGRHPNQTSIDRWDTIDGLIGIECKTFYVTSDADFAFSMDIADRCSRATNGALNYKNGFSHGQSQGAYEENLPNFAKYCCGLDTTFMNVVSHPTRENPRIAVEPYGGAKVESVWLYYTSDELVNDTATWRTKFVSFANKSEYSFTVPESTHAYVRIRYSGNKTVCSYLF